MLSTAGPHAPPVLIVDDDPAIRQTLRLVLEDAGYAPLEARDGVECLDLLVISDQRLVVLLDVMMPRMTGFEVLAWVASEEAFVRHHRYILITADIAAAGRLGPHVSALLLRLAIPIVPKPFDLEDVLAAVARAAGSLTADAAPTEQTGGAEAR